MDNLFFTFSLIITVNVILCAVKNVLTARELPFQASLMTAIQASFNNIVTIYTVQDFPLWQKCLVSLVVNFVFTYFIMNFLRELDRNKLWKLEFTTYIINKLELEEKLTALNIPHSYIELGKHVKFECYLHSYKDTSKVKALLKDYDVKYFISSNFSTL